MPVELSALFERECAPVAQWIEQLTSDYPGRCAVAPSVGGGAYGPSYLLSSCRLRLYQLSSSVHVATSIAGMVARIAIGG